MAINFPSSPTDGQTLVVNSITYVYNSSIGAWIIQADAVSLASINVTSGIIIAGTMNVVPTITSAFGKANTANITADLAFGQANQAFAKANTAYVQANSAYTQANVAIDTALAFAIALG